MHIKPGADLRITPWVVHKVLGLQVNTRVITAAFSMKERNKEYNELRNILRPAENDKKKKQDDIQKDNDK